MEKVSLLPCPFCGSSDVRLQDGVFNWLVTCDGCKVTAAIATRWYPPDMAKVAAAWNKRAVSAGDVNA